MLFIDSLIGFAFYFLQLSRFFNMTPLNNFQCIFARPIFGLNVLLVFVVNFEIPLWTSCLFRHDLGILIFLVCFRDISCSWLRIEKKKLLGKKENGWKVSFTEDGLWMDVYSPDRITRRTHPQMRPTEEECGQKQHT